MADNSIQVTAEEDITGGDFLNISHTLKATVVDDEAILDGKATYNGIALNDAKAGTKVWALHVKPLTAFRAGREE